MITIEETKACSSIRIEKATVEGIRLEDDFGETVCIAKTQAEALLPILQHFIETGEMPE